MKKIKFPIQIDNDPEVQKKELVLLIFVILTVVGFGIGFFLVK